MPEEKSMYTSEGLPVVSKETIGLIVRDYFANVFKQGIEDKPLDALDTIVKKGIGPEKLKRYIASIPNMEKENPELHRHVDESSKLIVWALSSICKMLTPHMDREIAPSVENMSEDIKFLLQRAYVQGAQEVYLCLGIQGRANKLADEVNFK